jgi:predicted CoA-binding protein
MMSDIHPVIKKLQYKDKGQHVLIINAPKAYDEVITGFKGEVHINGVNEGYDFVQVFGTSNEELQTLAHSAEAYVKEDALFWLCYPKKSSKLYKGSDCSRETVTKLLKDEGYEPVRQIAIDEDWSALRFRKVENIKSMTRKFAVTEQGKIRTDQ